MRLSGHKNYIWLMPDLRDGFVAQMSGRDIGGP